MVAAVRVHKTGGPEVLTYEDAAIPAPGQGQIKIKTHAAGVNFIDCYFRNGSYPAPSMPFIAGNESAGEVIAVGPGVTDLKVGDRVAYVGPLGGYAAERVFNADRAVKLPDNITYEQAAGMMLKGMTVQYLVNRTFKVGKGTIVLIHAAAGGVGLIACQWANHLGATVIGTCRRADTAFLQSLGVDTLIDVDAERFEDVAQQVDVVLDTVGGDTLERSFTVVRPGGAIVSSVSAPDPQQSASHGIRGKFFYVSVDTPTLLLIATLLDAGKIKPHVGDVLPLSQARLAHEMLEGKAHKRGKIVLTTQS